MNCVIVPTDFSANSYNALELAKVLVAKSSGIIYLIHIVEPMSAKYLDDLNFGINEINISQVVKKIGDELQHLKNKHAGMKYKIHSELKVGDPFTEIKKLVIKYNSDLMVLGAKGMRNAKEFFLGSLTDKIIRSMPCPVISVKELVEQHNFSNIVFSYTTGFETSDALYLLEQFQTFFDSKIHFLNIKTKKNNSIRKRSLDLQSITAIQRNLQNYTMNCYDHEDEEYGVIYYSDKVEADLIVMGVHEKSGFRRLISGGSIAKKISNHTFRPILTFPIKKRVNENN